MDLNLLGLFVAVAETGSFSQAALSQAQSVVLSFTWL
jgi:DNA-binding transcriptional LysR family regulator